MADELFQRAIGAASHSPGVEVSTSYGTPALKVNKKLLARLREDGESLVVPCESLGEKEFLLATEPGVYFQTPHYENGRYVLVRLNIVTDARLREMLEAAWRRLAPKKVVAGFEAR